MGLLLAGAAVVGAALVAAALIAIRRAAHGRTYDEVAAIPHRPVGLVLGCSKHLRDGRENLFFLHRVAAAAELFGAGKVDHLLVSGDNRTVDYDEATDMKEALVARGVPESRVTCDFAGLRTLDSIVRAKEVFGQTELTVVSQEFHNQRAIFIAGRRGIDAIGFNADEVDAFNSFRTRCREHLARVKAVLDVCVLGTQPKFLGEKIHIRLAAGSASEPAGAGTRSAAASPARRTARTGK